MQLHKIKCGRITELIYENEHGRARGLNNELNLMDFRIYERKEKLLDLESTFRNEHQKMQDGHTVRSKRKS